MEYDSLILEKEDGIATLTLNRPHKLNAIDAVMMRELPVAFQEVAQDEEVRVLIITGTGRGFCSGLDIGILGDIIAGPPGEQTQPEMPRSYPGVLEPRYLAKPVIAAVNGIAAGGGLVLAMAADIRIASEKATFSQIFIRLGVPDGASTFLLPKLVGLGKALELAFTGDFIDAREAERIGLVNKVVPHGALMQSATELAARIAKGPPATLAVTKEAMCRGFTATDLDSHVEYELKLVGLTLATEDFKEGVTAFLEKREPFFKGR